VPAGPDTPREPAIHSKDSKRLSYSVRKRHGRPPSHGDDNLLSGCQLDKSRCLGLPRVRGAIRFVSDFEAGLAGRQRDGTCTVIRQRPVAATF
jgi:hypothetical protein